MHGGLYLQAGEVHRTERKGKETAMLTTLIVFPAILMIMGFETFRTIGR
jgi:hypothetical protein